MALALLSKIKNKFFLLIFHTYVRWNKRLFTSNNLKSYLLINFIRQYKYSRSCIKNNENILDIPATLVLESWGGRTPSFYGFESSILEAASTSISFLKDLLSLKLKHFMM